MNKEAFIEAVRQAGIVGEGGAGFPAHVKYAASADTVIANGCECEPLLHSDHHVMAHHSAGMFRALRALADAVGANRAVLGMKKKHTDIIPALTAEAATYGIEVFLLDDFYPAGDEQILVREVTGRSVPPLGIPLHVGVVVANVATLMHVDEAMQGKPIIMKTITVTGAVQKPSVLTAPIGTSLADCLATCGGSLVADPAYIIGGPMMGRVIDSPEAFAKEVLTKTSGGLIILPKGSPLHKNATQNESFMRKRAASACIQCRMCSDLCPRNLIGHPFETHKVMQAFAAGMELHSENATQAMMCCECGVCEQFACPMGMSPRRINQVVKGHLRGAQKNYEGSREVREYATTWRNYRKVPSKRLAARIGILDYLPMPTPFLGTFAPQEVRIPVRQHIGAPSVPCVQVGTKVQAGTLIADIPEKALGAKIHASMTGTVKEVTTDFIRIVAE